jgi:hypothetical protein
MAQFVTFNYAEWIAQYPMFNVAPTITTELVAQNYFNMAGMLYLRNDGSGPISNPERQKFLLYLLTCHLAALITGYGGQAPSGLVGRVSSASEGSVSVSVDFPSSPNGAWFNMTPWGALYWQATASLRTMQYRGGPTRFGSGRTVGLGPGRRYY